MDLEDAGDTEEDFVPWLYYFMFLLFSCINVKLMQTIQTLTSSSNPFLLRHLIQPWQQSTTFIRPQISVCLETRKLISI